MSPPVMAIVQARMGSTRLPGKSLRKICGIPLILHVIERLKLSRRITRIVVATTTESADTPLAVEVTHAGVEVVRGSEHNVLSRFAEAAEKDNGDYLARVTGDAPFVDAVAIDRMVDILAAAKADFFSLIPGETPIHEGFEVFSRHAFERLKTVAADDPVAREHVTGYFKQHPEFVTTAPFPIPESEQFAGARLSVDTPADVLFVETIYDRLGCPAPFADVRDVVALLRKAPSLLEINRHVHQKSLTEKEFRVVLVCESGGSIGYGHLMRTLGLAEVLRDCFAAAVSIWIIGDEQSSARAIVGGFRVSHIASDGLNELMIEGKPDVIVADVLTQVSPEKISEWRSAGIGTVLIDDGSDRRLWADQVFYGAVPQADRMDWKGAKGKVYKGFEYAITTPVFEKAPNRIPEANMRILVSMGGSDPAGLTPVVLQALRQIKAVRPMTITVVSGPGFTDTVSMSDLTRELPADVQIVHAPKNLRDLMIGSDMGILSFGVTAYEAAAMELPAVYLCLTPDHAESAEPFVEKGIGMIGGVCTGDAGNCNSIDIDKLCAAIETMTLRATTVFTSGTAPLNNATKERMEVARKVRKGTRHVAETILALGTKS